MNSLLKLSNEQLEMSFKFFIKKERQILHIILEHIKEINRRELHLRKYPSLIEYLIKDFGYSETAARARIGAARLLNDVPELAEKIQDGSMNLAKISELSRAVKEKELSTREKVTAAQKIELVAMISGKTTRESQKDLAQALDIQVKEFEFHRVQKDESVRHEFTASKQMQEKIDRCRNQMSHKISQEHMDHTLASMLELVMDFYLAAKEGSSKIEISSQNQETTLPDKIDRINKTITSKTRRLIIQRDKCCQHVDQSSGKKCESRFALQTDHKTSRWAGGDNSFENLQALCASHNQLKYRKEAQLRFV